MGGEMSRPTGRCHVLRGDVTSYGATHPAGFSWRRARKEWRLCGCGAWESRPWLRERANLFAFHACRAVNVTRTPLHPAHDGVHGHERCISFSDHVRLPLSAIEAFE